MPRRTSRTGSELFIVDNSETDWKVVKYLHDWCQIAKSIDIATGYFEIGSLLSLKDEWQKVDKIRILMGDEVSKRTKRAFEKGLQEITARLDDSIEREKEKNDFLTGVSAIAEAIRSKKIKYGTRIELSQNRLEGLLNQRLQNRNDPKKVEYIDQRTWDLFGEEWCVLFTDLSGFSKHSDKFSVIHFLQTIKESERIFSPIIEEYDGFVVKTEGDSLIVIFRSTEKALDCVVKMQYSSIEYNQNLPEEEQIILCCGLSRGTMLMIPGESVDIYGEEVNFAAKLGEDIAGPGETLITQRLAEFFPTTENLKIEEHGHLNNGRQKIFKVLY